jgi:hypothetical protein
MNSATHKQLLYISLSIVLSVIAIVLVVLYLNNVVTSSGGRTALLLVSLSLFAASLGLQLYVLYSDVYDIRHMAQSIVDSRNLYGWRQSTDLQLKTLFKCIPFMNRRYKKESGNLFNENRFIRLQGAVQNGTEEEAKRAKLHIYETAVSCSNLAKMVKGVR